MWLSAIHNRSFERLDWRLTVNDDESNNNRICNRSMKKSNRSPKKAQLGRSPNYGSGWLVSRKLPPFSLTTCIFARPTTCSMCGMVDP